MFLSTALLACMHAMVRHLGGQLHPFEIAFFRNLFGLIAVLPLIFTVGLAGLRSRQPRLQVLRGTTGLMAMLGWFYGLTIVPIATATALSFSAAIFASLGAVVLLGERMHLRRWSAVTIGIVGVLIVLRPGAASFDPGTLFIVGSALLWGFNVVIVKQLSKTDTTVSIVAWMSASLTVLSFVPALLVWTWPTGTQLLWLALIGLTGTCGHLTMVKALKLADATAVMSVDFSRLIWTTAMGSLIFADRVDLLAWVGGSIIFISGLYILYRESQVKVGT
jgi:drug/metabolite transporter (DMT)-like permease